MNFRQELNSIKDTETLVSNKNKYDSEYILKDVLITYLRYLVCADMTLGKIEVVFSVENTLTNILEVIVKSSADNYTGTVIYYKYFPQKNGAMQTIKSLQKIFVRENFEINFYSHTPGYTRPYEKRFSVFIELN